MPKTQLVNQKRWKTSNTAVFNCSYHIIFCPKYRKKVLVEDVETLLKKALIDKAVASGWDLQKMEVMPDRVHLFIKATPADAPQFIAGQLKGYSAHELRKKFPHLFRRLGTLWTRSYYIETIGNFSKDAAKQYIESQKRNPMETHNSSS